MTKRVYINGERTSIEIRDEYSGGGGGGDSGPGGIIALVLFLIFDGCFGFPICRFMWFMLKLGTYCLMLGFFWADPSSFGIGS